MYGYTGVNVSPIERARKKYALTDAGAKLFGSVYLRTFLDMDWKSEEEVFDRACKDFEGLLANDPDLSQGGEDS